MKFPSPALAVTTLLTFAPALVANANQTESAPQLVLKQDFERTDSVRDWRVQTSPDTKAFSVTRDSAAGQAHSGQAALKYEVTEAGEKERYIFGGAKLPASDGTVARSLRIRFYARTAAATEDQAFTFRVLERDEAKPTGWLAGKTETIKIGPSTEWKEFSFTGKLASKTQGLTLYFVAKKPVLGQILWVDDLSVEVIPEATP